MKQKRKKVSSSSKDQPVTQRQFERGIAALTHRMATKDDLKAYATKDDLKVFATKDDLKAYATKDDLKDLGKDLRGEMKQLKDEIIREFHVVAENIHLDVAGANRDEIVLLKDKQEDHEQRITAVEQRAGL